MVENKDGQADSENSDDKGHKASEDLSKLYFEGMASVKEGQIVRGKIIAITPKGAIIDIGYKSEGAVSLSEFQDPDAVKVGDELDVYLESKEDENGMVVLSKEKAERAVGWDMVVSRYGEGDILDGRVTRKIKGGFMVDIGVEI